MIAKTFTPQNDLKVFAIMKIREALDGRTDR